MLKSNNVQATVTSKNYGEHLNKMLKINKKYTLLHDIYHGNYNISYQLNGLDIRILIVYSNLETDRESIVSICNA